MAGLRMRVLNIEVKRWFESTESSAIIPVKMKDIPPGMRPHLMNAEANKIGGAKNETTKEYPEYFLIRGMDDCLAISTTESISLRERPLSSGMIHVITNMN